MMICASFSLYDWACLLDKEGEDDVCITGSRT